MKTAILEARCPGRCARWQRMAILGRFDEFSAQVKALRTSSKHESRVPQTDHRSQCSLITTRPNFQNAADNMPLQRESTRRSSQGLARSEGRAHRGGDSTRRIRRGQAGLRGHARAYACSRSVELGIVFDTLLHWTKKHFPDCDVTTEIRHMGHSPTYGVRVAWAMSTEDALQSRRLEKETLVSILCPFLHSR
jgi:hypothetical protein